MKKYILLVCFILLLTGCYNKTEKIELNINNEYGVSQEITNELTEFINEFCNIAFNVNKQFDIEKVSKLYPSINKELNEKELIDNKVNSKIKDIVISDINYKSNKKAVCLVIIEAEYEDINNLFGDYYLIYEINAELSSEWKVIDCKNINVCSSEEFKAKRVDDNIVFTK